MTAIARIYEGEGSVPEGFNVIRILLDVTERSLLNWKEAMHRAADAAQKGLQILWELQFDLMSDSLDDETRFMTLQLNVQHFNDVIWSQFKEHTFGVALFRGELKTGVVEYLLSLAALLSDELSSYLFLDTTSAIDLESYFQMVDQEKLGHLRLILKGHYAEKYPYAREALGWGHGKSALGYCSDVLLPHLPQRALEYGICLPKNANWQHVEWVIDALGECPFRLIHENLLTHEWDGIEKLIVFSEHINEKLQRKMLGFLASGGEIITFPDDAAWLQLQENSQQPSSLVFSQQTDQ